MRRKSRSVVPVELPSTLAGPAWAATSATLTVRKSKLNLAPLRRVRHGGVQLGAGEGKDRAGLADQPDVGPRIGVDQVRVGTRIGLDVARRVAARRLVPLVGVELVAGVRRRVLPEVRVDTPCSCPGTTPRIGPHQFTWHCGAEYHVSRCGLVVVPEPGGEVLGRRDRAQLGDVEEGRRRIAAETGEQIAEQLLAVRVVGESRLQRTEQRDVLLDRRARRGPSSGRGRRTPRRSAPRRTRRRRRPPASAGWRKPHLGRAGCGARRRMHPDRWR